MGSTKRRQGVSLDIKNVYITRRALTDNQRKRTDAVADTQKRTTISDRIRKWLST